ncbi:helix-turn-helix domain-containing protein [Robertmurraya sp. Marseille-Q9965]
MLSIILGYLLFRFKYLKISKPSAYELMNQNDFPLIKIGRCKRVLKDDFFEWLANEAQNKSR